MLWSVVLMWLGAQIAFKAFKHKKGVEQRQRLKNGADANLKPCTELVSK